jgi:hypothetical protein
MPTASKFNDFVRQLCNKEHDMDTDDIRIALTNTAPAGGNSYMSSITQISYAGVLNEGTGARALTGKVLSQAAGVAKFVADDISLTGTGAGFGPFQYLVVYNNTPATDATRGLICSVNYGSSISVAAGEVFNTDFDQANGIFTIGP